MNPFFELVNLCILSDTEDFFLSTQKTSLNASYFERQNVQIDLL